MEAEIAEYRSAHELRARALKRMCETEQAHRAAVAEWNAADEAFDNAKARFLTYVLDEQAVGA
jgi:hypothetical protein